MNEINTEQAENIAPKEEKLFTQDEVNKIIQNRLYERKKEQGETEQSEREIKEKEKRNVDKEKELCLRESRIACREYLQENGHPKDLIDILDASNFESFKEKVEKIADMYPKVRKRSVYPTYNPEPDSYDACTSFPNSKHTPKKLDGYDWQKGKRK